MQFLMAVPSVIIFYVVYGNITIYKHSVKQTVAAVSLTSVITMLVLFVLYRARLPGADVAINLVFTLSVFWFSYSKSKLMVLSAYYAVFVSALTMITAGAYGAFLGIIFDIRSEVIRAQYLVYFANLVPTIVLCWAVSKYVGRRLNKIYVRLSFDVKHKYAVYGLVLSSLTFLLAHTNLMAYRIIDDRVLLSSISVTMLAVVFLTTMIMTANYSLSQQNFMEEKFKNQQREDLLLYTKHLESAFDDMRRFRHDYKAVLQALWGFTEKDNSAGLKKYLEQVTADAEQSLNKFEDSLAILKHIHITELKGILAVKFAQAQAAGIEVELDIAKPVDNIPVEGIDLCRMAGIIADNAIEELNTNEHLSKTIRFGILVSDTEILIICVNPCGAQLGAEDIFNKGCTTKGSGRGLGLFNLKQICAKYDIYPTVRIENGEFAIVLMIKRV